MKQILLGFLVVAIAPLAHAGRIVGNGGDVVVCRNADNSIRSIELLDFYEARVERDQIIQLDPNKSVEENVAIYMQRLGSYDLYQKNRFQALYQEFNNDARFMPGVELVDIPDSNHISFPVGCKVEQIAIQKNPQYPGERRYSVNKDLWDKLTTADRAGLIMHEIIYRDTVLLADKLEDDVDSIPTRFLNSTIAANGLTALRSSEYFRVLSRLNFEYASWREFIVEISYAEFFENGYMNGVMAKFDQEQQVNLNNDISVTAEQGSNAFLFFSEEIQNQFTVFRSSLKEQKIKIGNHKIKVGSEDGLSPAVEIQFDESGRVSQINEVKYRLPHTVFNVPKTFSCSKFTFLDTARESFSCEKLAIKSDPLEVISHQAEVAIFGSNRKLATAVFNEYSWQTYSYYEVNYQESGYPQNMKCLLNASSSSCIVPVKYNDKLGKGHVRFQMDDIVEFDSQGNYLSGGQFFED